MLNERDWRRRNRDRDEEKKKKEKKEFWWENGNDPRTEKESTFYTSPTKDGTIKQKKTEEKAKPDIPTIKDNIEAAEKKVNQLKNEQFDLMAAGGRDDQIYTAKKNVENAQKEVESLNLQLTEAYGLGPNGYWNNKNQMNEQDRIVHEAGQKPTTAAQPATTPTVKPKPITRPKTVTELDNWVNNPEGYRPPNATAAVRPKVTAPVTPRKRVTRVPTTHLDMDIAQMQDELVHNPNMSEQKRWGIEDKITKLSADRDVLRWKKTLDHSPAIEEYQAQQRQASRQHQYAQDEYVNAIGSGKVKPGSEESYAMQAKIDKLEEKAKAYNRGMMGVLDGEKAVHRNEQGHVSIIFEGEEEIVERNNRLIDTISQFFWDKANRNISPEEFNEKYPYGDDYLKVWRRQLAEIIGEERTDNFIKSCEQIEVGRQKKQAEVDEIIWSELPQEERDRTSIQSALGVIANGQGIEELGLENVNAIALSVLNEIEENEGFTSEENFFQLESPLSGNHVYTSRIDGNYVEMEVLTDWSARPFGGKGTQSQNFLEKAFKLLELVADAPETLKELAETVVQEIIEIGGDEISEYYNPGKNLKENDVRISIKLKKDAGTNLKYNYFLRDGQLMYVTYNGGLMWANEDYFNKDE